MKWILILSVHLWHGDEPSITSAEFLTEEACRAAIVAYADSIPDSAVGVAQRHVDAAKQFTLERSICVPNR